MALFIDSNSVVDKEGLRLFVLNQLTIMKLKAEELCVERADFWKRLRLVITDTLLESEQEKALRAVDQLIGLPYYISTWIETAVDSAERFGFFVMTKAHELKSGEQDKDYFWALQIRHDQLVALVRVLEILLDTMKLWVSLRPEKVLDDPLFSGLTEFGLEEQVFLEAEKIYNERMKIAGVKHHAGRSG